MSHPFILLVFTFILCIVSYPFIVEGQSPPRPPPEIERCTFANEHEARRNKDCKVTLPEDSDELPKYCTTDDSCKPESERAFRPETTANGNLQPNEFCATGFHPGENRGNSVRDMPDGKDTPQRCFALANYGCGVPNEDDRRSTTVCIDFKPLAAGRCPEPLPDPEPSFVTVGLGEKCGYQNDEEFDVVCGYNLFCNANRKCERSSSEGGPCGTTNGVTRKCSNGLTCLARRCVRKYSVPFGGACDPNNHFSCSTGFCSPDGVCGRTYTLDSCRRDADCIPKQVLNARNNGGIYMVLDRTKSVCFVGEYNGKGTCSAVYQPAASDLEQCLVDECSAAEGQSGFREECKETVSADGNILQSVVPSSHPCHKKWVRRMCAEYCVQPSDRRYVQNVPYIFDCQAVESTKMDETSCSVTEQFTNCAAIRSYKSDAAQLMSVQSLMLSIVACVALVALLI